ncbi:hypothetical protein VZT92_022945 [Zoarces viviparus]|uniref:Secreted protein n=1 Tax=Zoarces viviparus TaxID=48416 RepID=A0AAW1E534_ZOAVI
MVSALLASARPAATTVGTEPRQLSHPRQTGGTGVDLESSERGRSESGDPGSDEAPKHHPPSPWRQIGVA